METKLMECMVNFIKFFWGRYVVMMILFLLFMRVSVILVNVITGHGLHLGGYIGSADAPIKGFGGASKERRTEWYERSRKRGWR